MTEQEILDFYNENWNDYNLIVDLLHRIIDDHEREISILHKKLLQKNHEQNDSRDITELRILLRECQDRLDEETHKL